MDDFNVIHSKIWKTIFEGFLPDEYEELELKFFIVITAEDVCRVWDYHKLNINIKT